MFKYYKNDKEFERDKAIEEMAKIMDIDCGECYTCEYYNNVLMICDRCARKEMAENISRMAKEKRDCYNKFSLQYREKGNKEREYYYIGKESAMEEIIAICKECCEV